MNQVYSYSLFITINYTDKQLKFVRFFSSFTRFKDKIQLKRTTIFMVVTKQKKNIMRKSLKPGKYCCFKIF